MNETQRKRVGIDLDETWADYVGGLSNFLAKRHNIKLAPDMLATYTLWKDMGWQPDEDRKYFTEFSLTPEYRNLRPVEGSQESIEELAKRYELHVVTSRPKDATEATMEWIDKNYRDHITGVHITDGYNKGFATKTNLCKEMGIPIMLEDGPEYATHLSENGIYVVLFDKTWNKNINGNSMIKRVSSWKEAVVAVDGFYGVEQHASP